MSTQSLTELEPKSSGSRFEDPSREDSSVSFPNCLIAAPSAGHLNRSTSPSSHSDGLHRANSHHTVLQNGSLVFEVSSMSQDEHGNLVSARGRKSSVTRARVLHPPSSSTRSPTKQVSKSSFSGMRSPAAPPQPPPPQPSTALPPIYTDTELDTMSRADLVEHIHSLQTFIEEFCRLANSACGGTTTGEPPQQPPDLTLPVPMGLPVPSSSANDIIPTDSKAHFLPDLLTHSLYLANSVASEAWMLPVRTTAQLQKAVDDDGSKLINDYVVLQELGRGAFGKVKLAYDPHNCRMVAIKIVRKSTGSKALRGNQSDAFATLQREIAVMKKLRHKNIVNLYEVIDDPESNKLYLVMRYVDKGPIGKIESDLSSTKYSPEELLPLATNVINGLCYLHARNIVHRDLKPENILVSSDGEAFLVDFGVSEMFERDEASHVEGKRGTKLFMAPELLHSTGKPVKGRAVDVWALGVTFYALLTGRLPFSSIDEIIDVQKTLDLSPLPKAWSSMIQGMLHHDAEQRVSVVRLRGLLKEIDKVQRYAKRVSIGRPFEEVKQLEDVVLSPEDWGIAGAMLSNEDGEEGLIDMCVSENEVERALVPKSVAVYPNDLAASVARSYSTHFSIVQQLWHASHHHYPPPSTLHHQTHSSAHPLVDTSSSSRGQSPSRHEGSGFKVHKTSPRSPRSPLRALQAPSPTSSEPKVNVMLEPRTHQLADSIAPPMFPVVQAGSIFDDLEEDCLSHQSPLLLPQLEVPIPPRGTLPPNSGSCSRRMRMMEDSCLDGPHNPMHLTATFQGSKTMKMEEEYGDEVTHTQSTDRSHAHDDDDDGNAETLAPQPSRSDSLSSSMTTTEGGRRKIVPTSDSSSRVTLVAAYPHHRPLTPSKPMEGQPSASPPRRHLT